MPRTEKTVEEMVGIGGDAKNTVAATVVREGWTSNELRRYGLKDAAADVRSNEGADCLVIRVGRGYAGGYVFEPLPKGRLDSNTLAAIEVAMKRLIVKARWTDWEAADAP